jgi:hypothetical protein
VQMKHSIIINLFTLLYFKSIYLYVDEVLPLGSAALLTRLSRAVEPSGNLQETVCLNLRYSLLEPQIPTA